MNSSLARLVGQAEAHMAGLGRRAVDSVATPLRIRSQEIATDTLEAVSRTLKVIVIKAVLGLVAAIMAVVAIVYAIAALYQKLLPILGPVEARLVLAGAFALVAILAVVAMVAWPGGKPTAKVAADKAGAEADRAMADARAAVAAATHAAEARAKAAGAAGAAPSAAYAQAPPPPADLKDGFETIVSVLGDAGFRREQAGLKAGLALASQLKPMQIVSLALIGGFIAGMRSGGGRRR